MKIEEVIKQLESIADHTRSMAASPDADDIWKEDIDALVFAITALRSMQEAGEALTLEQLREMDGQPVWCECLLEEDRKDQDGEWFIVVKEEENKYGFELKKPLDFGCLVFKNENYSTGWLAYSYPPAHIGREAWTAEWIEDGDCEHKPHRIRDVKKWRKYKCSKCGYKAGRSNSRNYCPSCGRAMTPEALAELERRLRLSKPPEED